MAKIDPRWWNASKDQAYQTISKVVKYLDDQQSYVSLQNLKSAKLYGNMDILGLNAYNYIPTSTPGVMNNRLTLNVIKSCVDTACNKIAKNKPRPMFLTSNGEWNQQNRAKKLTQFCEGLFYETKIYDTMPLIFRDSCLFNSGGWMKIYRTGKKIHAERVFCEEMKYDDVEAFYGTFRTLYQTKHVSRETAIELFPNKKNLLMNTPEIETKGGGDKGLGELIQITESWRLPSESGKKDGKHMIVVENGTLSEDVYKADYFPFVWMYWTRPVFGARGQSLCDELTGIQIEINRILRTIQQILRLTVPKLFVEKGAKVVYSHLNSDIGGVVEFTGTKPVYDFLQAIPPDLTNQLDRLYMRAFEIAGISQLAAQAKKPAGLDSGKALREFNDIESERFILKGYEYEQAFMQAARIMVDLAKDIDENEEGGFKVKSSNKRFVEWIEWKDVNLEEDQYVMKIFPTSSLSQTPAGRLQDVQELLQAGFISKEDGLRLLDFPDLERTLSLDNAAVEDIESVIDQMIEKGEYEPPEQYQNLVYGIKKVQSAYLRAKLNKAPEDRLELLRRWIDAADAMLVAAQPPAQAPMAVPEAPPVSDLLPSAPMV